MADPRLEKVTLYGGPADGKELHVLTTCRVVRMAATPWDVLHGEPFAVYDRIPEGVFVYRTKESA